MKKLYSGLAAITMTAALSGNAFAQTPAVPCTSEAKVLAVAEDIKGIYREVRPDVYLIQVNPETKKGTSLSGQLTVYLPDKHSPDPKKRSRMSIFDRTSQDTRDWYNFSNLDSSNPGCADSGVALGGNPKAGYLSQREIQTKFNEFIDKLYAYVKK